MSFFRRYFYKTSRTNVFIFSFGLFSALAFSFLLKPSIQGAIVSHKQGIAIFVAFLALGATVFEVFEENSTAPEPSKWVKPFCKGVTIFCGIMAIFIILLDSIPEPSKDQKITREEYDIINRKINKINSVLEEVSQKNAKTDEILKQLSYDIKSEQSVQGNGPSQKEKNTTLNDISSNLSKIEESEKRNHILLQHLSKKYEPQIVNRSECQTPHPCYEMPVCSYHP